MEVPTVLCSLSGYAAAERALPSAYDAAHAMQTKLHLFSAVEDLHMVGRREQYLVDVAAKTRPPAGDLAGTTVVVDPHAPEAVAHAAKSSNVFAVLATSSQPLMHTGYVGSVAERVMRDAHHPVVLIGPHATTRLGDVERVVVPCDGSQLSEQAVEVGQAWGERLGIPVWIVTVISPRDAARAGYDANAESNYVHRLARPLGAQWEVLHGDDAAKTLVDWAGPTSLIAMTTHGRSGLSRFTIGSVTVAVTRWALGPVLVTNGSVGR